MQPGTPQCTALVAAALVLAACQDAAAPARYVPGEFDHVKALPIQEIAVAMHLAPGNVPEARRDRLRVEVEQDKLLITLPAMKGDEYIQGFRFEVDIHSLDEGTEDYRTYVVLRGHAEFEGKNTKDLLVVRSSSGAILSQRGLVRGDVTYYFPMGVVRGDVRVTVGILEQNLGPARDAPVAFALGACSVVHVNAARKTEDFIRGLDIERYVANGLDFDIARRSPHRGGIPLEDLDPSYNYDFDELDRVEKRLLGIDRLRVLQHIFAELTRDDATDTAKHLSVLGFMHRASFHNLYTTPVHRDGSSVTDPLILLEMGGELQCGNIARLGADLFEAGGYRSRIVEMASHQSAEVFYEGSWHTLDGDLFGNGETVLVDGRVPSVQELSESPFLIDALHNYAELEYFKQAFEEEHRAKCVLFHEPYPSSYYFSKARYQAVGQRPSVHEKKDLEKHRDSRYYGWDHYETRPVERVLFDGPEKFPPSSPVISRIEATAGADPALEVISLEWQPSVDPDGDLVGYRVFVSKAPRGWNYQKFRGPESLQKYWNRPTGWSREMYGNLFKVPNSEIAHVETADSKIDLTLHKGGVYYVSIMPVDAHGLSVGKRVFNMSEELVLRL